MPPIRVLVCGACGKMGRTVVQAVLEQPDMALAAAVDVVHVGEDVGTVTGAGELGVAIEHNLETAAESGAPDVMVDFTQPAVVMANIRCALARRIACVVGTTGLSDDDLAEVRRLCGAHSATTIVAPNFSLGATLMMQCAQLVAPHFDYAEILELHHEGKKDAPSGTALRTADLMAEARSGSFDRLPTEDVKLDGVRGGEQHGVVIHSVRLPGLVAHQSVLFGGTGETLTVRHDTTGRESFMPGVL
ncbi:MAG: 4-hydroxy-tetrahydrodipicolinate reductase, partial [Armatimonadota bacterium]